MGVVISIEFMIAGFLSYLQFVVIIYLSLAIGQFPKFQKHRTAASFIAFFVINMVMNWILGMVVFEVNSIEQFFSMNPDILLLIGNVGVIAIMVGLFEATNYILNKHLNLE